MKFRVVKMVNGDYVVQKRPSTPEEAGQSALVGPFKTDWCECSRHRMREGDECTRQHAKNSMQALVIEHKLAKDWNMVKETVIEEEVL